MKRFPAVRSSRNAPDRRSRGDCRARAAGRISNMVATARVLFSSPLVKVSDFTCTTPKSGCGCERCDARSSITIMRRGVHAYHARRQVSLAETGLALLYRGGEPYCLSHPYERRDRSTCIEFGTTLLEEAFGTRQLARDLGTHLRPGTQLLNLETLAALDVNGSNRLVAEETTLELIEAIVDDFDLARDDPNVRASAKRRVKRAREFIATKPEANHSLDAVAAAASCSPFHLAGCSSDTLGARSAAIAFACGSRWRSSGSSRARWTCLDWRPM